MSNSHPLAIVDRGRETQLQVDENFTKFTNGLPLQRGDRLWSSESDVCRRQILTS